MAKLILRKWLNVRTPARDFLMWLLPAKMFIRLWLAIMTAERELSLRWAAKVTFVRCD